MRWALLALLPFFVGTSFVQQPTAEAPTEAIPLGLGVAAPHLTPERPLYFYTINSIFQTPNPLILADSVTFQQGTHHIEIATAPPWLVPEELALDYDSFLLRVVTVSQNWVEVVVNMSEDLPRSTPRTLWVTRDAVAFYPWTEFLPTVAFVEPLDPADNLIRIAPDERSDSIYHAWKPVRPLAMQGDWLLIATDDLADRIRPTGWIRWRTPDRAVTGGYRLLIEYSLRA